MDTHLRVLLKLFLQVQEGAAIFFHGSNLVPQHAATATPRRRDQSDHHPARCCQSAAPSRARIALPRRGQGSHVCRHPKVSGISNTCIFPSLSTVKQPSKASENLRSLQSTVTPICGHQSNDTSSGVSSKSCMIVEIH